jgi:hypothetical protein
LVGQAVNFVAQGTWSEHNPQDKIGVITSALPGEPDVDGGIPVLIEGYIYAKDFREAATAIKLNQHMLGFSYETMQTILVDGDFNGDPVAMTAEVGYFTGASILLKDKAAYTSTSIAASADTSKEATRLADKMTMKPEHADALKVLSAAIKHIDSITDSIMQELGIADSDADDKGKVSAGTATDADNGVEAALSPNGDAPATGTEVPALQAAATVTTAVEPVATSPVVQVSASADMVALQAKVAELETQLQAAADAKNAQRTSIAYPNSAQPVAKMDVVPKDQYTSLLASIDDDKTLSVDERLAKKFELRDQMRKQAVN